MTNSSELGEGINMRGRCVDCAEKLSATRRLLGKKRCATCEKAFNEEMEEAERRKIELEEAQRDGYNEVLDQILPGVDMAVIGRRVDAAREISQLSSADFAQLDSERVTQILALLAEDRVLNPTEDQWLNEAMTILGREFDDEQMRDYLILAWNSGFVRKDPDPPDFLMKKDEVAHFHCLAAHLEATPEQELEWTGAEINAGMSGKAIGSAVSKGRAKIVTTGTKVTRTDTGQLVVTSERVLFLGDRQTIEIPVEQLAGVKVLPERVRLQVSNGQDSPVFEVGTPGDEIMATMILTTAKRKMGLLELPAPAEIPAMELPPIPKLLAESGYRDSQ